MITKHRTGYLRQKNKRFYLEYMVDGRRIKQMLLDDQGLPVTTRDAAERERLKIMAPLMVVEREQALRTVTQKLDDSVAAREESGKGRDCLKLVDAWQAYVASPNRPDSGPRTLKGYAAQWRHFLDWMQDKNPDCTELKQVTGRIAEAYAAYLLKETCDAQGRVVKHTVSTNTFNKHVILLVLVFRVLAKRAGMLSSPWTDIARKTENKISRRELTVEELNTVCNQATGEMQTLLLLGIYTGLRLGDCCTLQWGEVDLQRRLIMRVPNKTARRRAVPVHVPIHVTLWEHLSKTPAAKRRDAVVPEFDQMYRQLEQDVSKAVQRHFVKCNIRLHRKGTGAGTDVRAVVEVGFHSLRHTFVSLCRQANAPLSVVEAIVGHNNPAMTRHYTHVSELAASAAVGALPSVLGPVEGMRPQLAASEGPDGRWEQVKTLAGRLNGENWKVIQAEMLALAGA
jgi:integrase